MKNIIIFLFTFLSFSLASAQGGDPIIFDFSADMQGWKAYDLDGNGNTFTHDKRWYNDPNVGKTIETETMVLRYVVSNIDGSYLNGYDKEDNWIISPAIDVSKLTGNIDLEITGEAVNPRGTNFIYLYASSSNDIESFKNQTIDDYIGVVKIEGNNYPNFHTLTTEIDKSWLPDSPTIYIGIKRAANVDMDTHSSEINIQELALMPQAGSIGVVLTTNEVKAGKSLTKVAQNPVSNALMLQLNPDMAAAKTTVQVYNVAGQQMLNTKYSREISVAQLAPGMYIARVTDGNLTETVKFIKK